MSGRKSEDEWKEASEKTEQDGSVDLMTMLVYGSRGFWDEDIV